MTYGYQFNFFLVVELNALLFDDDEVNEGKPKRPLNVRGLSM